MSSGRSGFTSFEWGDSKPTCRRRVLELRTRGRPSEQLDRVNAGQVWSGWAGGQVGWTTLVFIAVGMTYVRLDITYFAENNKKNF